MAGLHFKKNKKIFILFYLFCLFFILSSHFHHISILYSKSTS